MDREITLAHGGGGEDTQKLIKELFFKHLGNPILESMEDSAILKVEGKIAYTTDGFTVKPIFFKGGNIGKLAVAGTVNDLAVMGAKPKYMTLSFIIEEGFPFEDLEKIVETIGEETKKLDLKVVAGDTKVLPKGGVDGIVISASGIGEVVYGGLSAKNLKEGDLIIVSGTIGDHGAAVMAQRLGFDLPIESDCAPLWGLIEPLLKSGVEIHAMRDPTRGGLSAVLHEWADSSKVDILVEEERIPIREEVLGLCEFLGLEPYHFASEGRVVIAVSPKDGDKVLEILRNHPLGKDAAVIGKVVGKSEKPKVILKTPFGVERIMEPPAGELLPRIC
ncbi:MAG TPA: hydrogenase expression/formation protein HypE [Aquificales bacterium]|nr:hydrogenase expression/formation protein HypE [Aquificales bacterium]